MAYTIPSNLISRSDVPSSAQDVARVLRTLPDQVTLFYDIRLAESPVWIIDPRRGLAAVRVVSSGPKSLRRKLFSLKGSELDLWEHLEQAENDAAEVLRRLRSSPHLSRDMPTAVLVALPKITRSQLQSSSGDVQGVIAKDELAPSVIDQALGRALGVVSMTEKEERAVRAAVTPEIIIQDRASEADRDAVVAFRAPTTNGQDVIAVLDREQQNLAMNLGDGYRVIRGVAGSGKSLVLTHRARYMAEQYPDLRILVTCFNIVIGRALAAELENFSNVDVAHIDSVAAQVCKRGRIRVPGKGGEQYEARRVAAAAHLAEGADDDEYYDVVLVDEAQDFDTSMLKLAYAHLERADGDFVVALDGAQNIYRKRSRWNPPGQTARGRTTVLRRNYRNTHEILSLAYIMLLRGDAEVKQGEGGVDDDDIVVRPEATSRRGPWPQVVSAKDRKAEIEAVCDQLETWHAQGARWSEMLVVFGNRFKYKSLYYRTRERRIPYYDVTYKPAHKHNVMKAGNVVRASTIQSSKGVEFPYVAVCGVNDISTGGGADDDEVARRRLLYVALTRATDNLFITVSGNGAIGSDLINLGS